MTEEHVSSEESVVHHGSGVCGSCGTVSGRNLLAGHRNEIMSSMHTELQEGVQALQEILRGARLDLLEICAPWDSPLTKAVEEAGGRAVALGLQNGYDLTTTSGFRKAAQFMREMKPRYVHISPPCFPWSPMQNLNQSREQIQRLLELRRKHRKLLHHCRRLAEIQVLEMNSHLSFDENTWISIMRVLSILLGQSVGDSTKSESWLDCVGVSVSALMGVGMA